MEITKCVETTLWARKFEVHLCRLLFNYHTIKTIEHYEILNRFIEQL